MCGYLNWNQLKLNKCLSHTSHTSCAQPPLVPNGYYIRQWKSRASPLCWEAPQYSSALKDFPRDMMGTVFLNLSWAENGNKNNVFKCYPQKPQIADSYLQKSWSQQPGVGPEHLGLMKYQVALMQLVHGLCECTALRCSFPLHPGVFEKMGHASMCSRVSSHLLHSCKYEKPIIL